MVPVKQRDETIGHYVQELNDATSRMAVTATLSNRIGWYTIIVNAVGTFLHVFILQGFIKKGIDGFIDARLASIYSLVQNIKRWEYQMRQDEGGRVHPPTSEDDLCKVKTKYSA
jgi:hypothetical protein